MGISRGTPTGIKVRVNHCWLMFPQAVQSFSFGAQLLGCFATNVAKETLIHFWPKCARRNATAVFVESEARPGHQTGRSGRSQHAAIGDSGHIQYSLYLLDYTLMWWTDLCTGSARCRKLGAISAFTVVSGLQSREPENVLIIFRQGNNVNGAENKPGQDLILGSAVLMSGYEFF